MGYLIGLLQRNSAEPNLNDQEGMEKETSHTKEVKAPYNDNVQKMPDKIFQPGSSTLQLKDLLYTNAHSNQQNNFSRTFLMNKSTEVLQNEHLSKSDQEKSFGSRTESHESLYSSVDPADLNDEDSSWITESYLSGDSSPCSTLTELNIK